MCSGNNGSSGCSLTEKYSEDVESESTRTEDSLLQGGKKKRVKRSKCGPYCGLTTGVILSILSIFLLIWTPYQILMTTRLDMIPGLPPFEWWRDPPQEVRLKFYLFNVTNSERFLRGEDIKLNVEEIGPVVYLEKLEHTDVQFNGNGTLSYTVKRTPVYLPEENTLDLNATVIVPNMALLGMASHISEKSFLIRMGFNVVLRGYGSSVFTKTTLYDYMWNFTDPILEFGRAMEPEMVPDLNIGVLRRIYGDFEDRATVYIGQENGDERFFLLQWWRGSEWVPSAPQSECQESVRGSTEGALYPQRISKTTRLKYWRKTLCKVITLTFENEQYMEKYDVVAYKFTKDKENYERKSNLSEDCTKGHPILPNGLFDVSACYNGVSMAASYPHYLYASDEVKNYVTGLTPNVTLHESFTYVEPLTGIPIESKARSQSNMIVKDTSGLGSHLNRFSNMAVPMFWIEYQQRGLPSYVKQLLILTVKLVPTYQYHVLIILLLLGIVSLFLSVRAIRRYTNT